MTPYRPGPPLERLIHRLAETPDEFLDEPRIAGQGRVAVAALVHDLAAGLGRRLDGQALARFDGTTRTADRNRLMLTALSVWLLSDDWFAGQGLVLTQLLALLGETLAGLAQAAPADRYASDPERREELARTVLAAFDFSPEGETAEQAADRLTAVSGTERRRLLDASREAELRARAVREALVRKRAEESADKWTRE